MDILDEELLKFWSSLYINGVRYIMVGGLATRLHGFNRNTDDIDLWLEDTLENRRKLRQTFIDLRYGDFPSIETMQFVPGWTTFHVAKAIELDIMTEMKGLESYTFAECLNVASIADFDGVQVPFLHINQLIINKTAVNRPKDLLDINELIKIRNFREDNDDKH